MFLVGLVFLLFLFSRVVYWGFKLLILRLRLEFAVRGSDAEEEEGIIMFARLKESSWLVPSIDDAEMGLW